jgi:protein SCO1/2
MTQQAAKRVLLALFVAACFVATALLAVNAMQEKRRRQLLQGDPGATSPDGGLRGGSASPSLFDDPLPLREFALTDHTGQPFGSAQLRGNVWIASFIFTRCPTVCPKVLAQTKQLQDQLSKLPAGKDIRLVSISVDPYHDTPTVLAETAKLWEADERWRFLTGAKDGVWSLIRSPDGFRDYVGDADAGNAMRVAHSSRFVLVDRKHRIRGFYDALDEEKRAELLRDVKRLLD